MPGHAQSGGVDQGAVNAALSLLRIKIAGKIRSGGQQHEIARHQAALLDDAVFFAANGFGILIAHGPGGDLAFAVGDQQDGTGDLLLPAPRLADVPHHAAVQARALVREILDQHQGQQQHHGDKFCHADQKKFDPQRYLGRDLFFHSFTTL